MSSEGDPMDSGKPPGSRQVKALPRRKVSHEGGESKAKSKPIEVDAENGKRRCVSTACIACRKRKSKCDGNLPSCAACASVYNTECIYDPHSDHRRKGVYKKDIDSLKTRNTTLQTLIQAIIRYSEDEAIELVKQIRSSDNLDKLAEAVVAGEVVQPTVQDPIWEEAYDSGSERVAPRFEKELSGKMGGLRLENDTIRFIGGTSNLVHDETNNIVKDHNDIDASLQYPHQEDAIRSWTNVTDDVDLILHLLNMYFTWHYTYFTALSKHLFLQDFYLGKPIHGGHRPYEHCTSLLVNALLAVGCHFTSWEAARAVAGEPSTAGDHFFKEAKRLFVKHEEWESPRLTTVQALAIMSVREAGCARETKGWVYSGMSFRMANDLGLNVRSDDSNLSEHEIDARRITFWGCFLFDKCWSNYLGRPPQLPLTNSTAPKFEVFPFEDADIWSPWTDSGVNPAIAQPSRTRAVALKISDLCEISNDILFAFYCAPAGDKKMSKQGEMKQLREMHSRLEEWRKSIPGELEAHDGQLPHVLTMHMFFQLLYIHLFRPFLKYAQHSSVFPANVNPRRICTQSALAISKLLRIYKRTYGFEQICNVVVYIAHAACTIHLLNLPDKDARRDVVQTISALDDITDHWPCARKALLIIGTQVRKWNIELPDEALTLLRQAGEKYAREFSPQAGAENGLAQQQQQQQLSPISSAAIGTDQPVSSHSSTPPLQNSHSKAVLDIQTNLDGLAANFPDHGVQGIPLSQDVITPTTASLMAESLAMPVSHSLMSGSYSGLEDTKDWWLKDQTSILDQWAGTESNSLSTSMSPELELTGYDWNASAMMAMNDGHVITPNKVDVHQSGLGEQQPEYGLNYMEYAPEGMYGYQGGAGS